MLKEKPLKCRRLCLVIGKTLETDIFIKFAPVNANGADFVFLPLFLSGMQKILVPKVCNSVNLISFAESIPQIL